MTYDATMLGALKVYARANQAVIVTPFILAGAMSPFGADLEFPLPIDQLWYRHPGPADRPNLAEGR